MADALSMDEANPDVKFWLGQIEGSQKWHLTWHERGQAVVDRYLDAKTNSLSETSTAHKMNVLWSNVQTVQPALYAKAATPRVQRRFRDKDPVGRWGAVVLERVEAYELDAYDDDYHYRQSILDYLLPGRGQVWVNYTPTISGGSDLRQQKLTWECCNVRHLHWKDFLTNPARTWDEVWWVAKREYLTEEEAKAQRLDVKSLTFEEQKDGEGGNSSTAPGERLKKAAVWEIWSKTHGKVYFVSKQCPELLRQPVPPTLKFESFFPCPRPLTATVTTDSIIPTPDYVQYQNQAIEIDRLSQKINLLTKALRVAGVYDASQEALGRLLENTDDNQLIPCDTYAGLASQGGVEGSITFFPLKDVVVALKQAYESREQAKAAMYEITGISDIVRGATNPDETATAQQIKSQWGGLRIRDRQKEVQRFIRDTMRLKAEVHAGQFQPTTLKTMSNVPLADQAMKEQLQARSQAQQMAAQNPQMAQQAMAQNPQLQALAKPLSENEKEMLQEPAWEEVVQLLKNGQLRGFRIDIETDSTIQADEMAEKQSRTELITSLTGFVEAWGPIIMQQPKAAPLAGELMLFGLRAFPNSDSLETVVEEFVEAIQQQPPPQAPGEDPSKMAAVKVQAEKNQTDAQLKNKEIDTKANTALTVEGMKLHAKAQDRAAGLHDSEQDRQLQHHTSTQDRAANLHDSERNRQASDTQDQRSHLHEEVNAQREDARQQESQQQEQDGSKQVLAAITNLSGEIQQLAMRVDQISQKQAQAPGA